MCSDLKLAIKSIDRRSVSNFFLTQQFEVGPSGFHGIWRRRGKRGNCRTLQGDLCRRRRMIYFSHENKFASSGSVDIERSILCAQDCVYLLFAVPARCTDSGESDGGQALCSFWSTKYRKEKTALICNATENRTVNT